ncbi:MAG TPA: J domain-containing protein [Pyrinomonadaceae bacterium]|jgi:curved DNA-binding protein CbpA
MDKYYKILEVQRGASIDEIKAAKIRLLQMWHPDSYQRNPELARIAEERTKLINDAYDKLLEYLKTGRQSPTYSKPHSGNSESNIQTEYKRRQANRNPQQKEKADQEHIARDNLKQENRAARIRDRSEEMSNRLNNHLALCGAAAGFIITFIIGLIIHNNTPVPIEIALAGSLGMALAGAIVGLIVGWIVAWILIDAKLI